jgi:tetratricopeptide (TPR) repeat protein
LEALVKDHANVPEYRHLLACCYRDAPPRGPRSVDAATDPAVKLLRQLVKDFPKVPDYRYDLAETLARMSMPVRPVRAEQDAAKKQLEEAVSLARGLLDEYPTVPLYAVSLALAHDRLGELLEQTDQPEQSERHYRKAAVLEASLSRQHPEVVAYDLTLSRIQRSLARVLADRKELTEARALLEASADRLDALLKKAPTQRERIRGSLGRTERDLAEVLTRLGEPELAAKARRRAEDLAPDHKGGPPPR